MVDAKGREQPTPTPCPVPPRTWIVGLLRSLAPARLRLRSSPYPAAPPRDLAAAGHFLCSPWPGGWPSPRFFSLFLFFSSFPSQHPCPPILPFRPRGPGPRLDWMDASVPGQDTRHGQYGTPTLRDCASSITKLGFRRGILHLVAQPCPQKHVFSLKENQDLDPIYYKRRILADS